MSWPCYPKNDKQPSLRSPRTLGVFFLLVGATTSAFAGPNRHVTDANVLYQTGQYQEALDIYNGLAKERPNNAALRFNQGAANYQLGNLDEAKSAFQSAAQLSEDPRLQALASYNLGNCASHDAAAQAQEDPEKAIETYVQGLRHYKNALAKNSNLKEAAENLETTRRAIQQLRELQQQQQQQQEQQQQQQEDAKEKLDELIDQQSQQEQESQSAAEKQQDPNQENPTQEQLSDQADKQQETREETESLAESMEQGEEQDPSPMNEAKEHAEKAAKKQKEAEEHLKNQAPDKANEAQEEALDELEQAREALDQGEEEEGDPSSENEGQDGSEGDSEEQQPSDQNQEGDTPPEDGQQNQQPEGQSAEEMEEVPPPDATARDILEQEKANKDARNLRQMIQLRPTEKDW